MTVLGWFKKRKAAKEDRKTQDCIDWWMRYYFNKKRAAEKSLRLNIEMTSKPCAVNNGRLCFSACVHYKKSVSFNGGFRDEYTPYFHVRYPSCKLWSHE